MRKERKRAGPARTASSGGRILFAGHTGRQRGAAPWHYCFANASAATMAEATEIKSEITESQKLRPSRLKLMTSRMRRDKSSAPFCERYFGSPVRASSQ